MSVYRHLFFFLPHFVFVFLSLYCGSVAALAMCPRLDVAVAVDGFRSQCPLWIARSFPVEVESHCLDRELARLQNGAFSSVLFYALDCPFSMRIRPTFEALSAMFPQIRHFAVEQSSAMPSVFSRHGIHSFPTLLLANRTASIRYHGPKDLDSFVHFYRELTGENSAAHFAVKHAIENPGAHQPWHQPVAELARNNPFLTFSLLFVVARALTFLLPTLITQFKASWTLYAQWHSHLGFFGVWGQLLGNPLHAIDVRKLWLKLGLADKASGLRKGARSARAWASSMASVSLGEHSSRTARAGS